VGQAGEDIFQVSVGVETATAAAFDDGINDGTTGKCQSSLLTQMEFRKFYATDLRQVSVNSED